MRNPSALNGIVSALCYVPFFSEHRNVLHTRAGRMLIRACSKSDGFKVNVGLARRRRDGGK